MENKPQPNRNPCLRFAGEVPSLARQRLRSAGGIIRLEKLPAEVPRGGDMPLRPHRQTVKQTDRQTDRSI
jgi:hypothetical protein